MDSPYAKEVNVAIRAVQRAATLSTLILTQAQQHDAENSTQPASSELGVVAKDDLSPVTIADFAIQALLTCTIHAAFPTDHFVGEESADALRANPALLERVWDALQAVAEPLDNNNGNNNNNSSRSEDQVVRLPQTKDELCSLLDMCGATHPSTPGRIWIFDPIDGTENFVRGLIYAINVALLVDGVQTAAVVGCPNMAADVSYPADDDSLDPTGQGCILLATHGGGAYVRTLPGGGASVQLRKLPSQQPSKSDELRPTSNLRSTSARNSSGLGEVHAEVARRLGVPWPGNTLLPWVLRWVLLALGVGNATWWIYRERSRLAKIWDHAGAMLLFEEVGGKVTDVDGKAIDLTANRKMTANYGIVAAPADVHAKVLETIHEVLREQRADLLKTAA